MAIVSIIRTPNRSALTVSGLDLSGDLHVSLGGRPICETVHGFAVSSNSGAAAIVDPHGRSGVLFGHESIDVPDNSGRWCRDVLRRSLDHGDLDEGAVWLADRLLADDRAAFTGLLSEYSQCHAVRFSRPGHPYVTSVRGNYALLSFWKEHPGITLAERAYDEFEAWIAQGLPDPLSLLPFHLVAEPPSETEPNFHTPAHLDVLQIRQCAQGTRAELRIWHGPKDVAARPALNLASGIASGGAPNVSDFGSR